MRSSKQNRDNDHEQNKSTNADANCSAHASSPLLDSKQPNVGEVP
jgi:hypothetical protein